MFLRIMNKLEGFRGTKILPYVRGESILIYPYAAKQPLDVVSEVQVTILFKGGTCSCSYVS